MNTRRNTTMTKLAETQTIVLSAGAQRPNNIAMPLPKGLAGAAAKMPVIVAAAAHQPVLGPDDLRPGLRVKATARPQPSVNAWILVVGLPRERPMA